jgi:hypothetical protein
LHTKIAGTFCWSTSVVVTGTCLSDRHSTTRPSKRTILVLGEFFFIQLEFFLKLVAQGGTSVERNAAPTGLVSSVVGKIPNDEFRTSLMRRTSLIKRTDHISASRVPRMFLGAVACRAVLFPPVRFGFGFYRITPLFVALPVFFLVLATAVIRDLASTASKEPSFFILGLVADEANAAVFDDHGERDGVLVGWNILCDPSWMWRLVDGWRRVAWRRVAFTCVY